MISGTGQLPPQARRRFRPGVSMVDSVDGCSGVIANRGAESSLKPAKVAAGAFQLRKRCRVPMMPRFFDVVLAVLGLFDASCAAMHASMSILTGVMHRCAEM